MMWGRLAGCALGAAAMLLGISVLPGRAPAQGAIGDSQADVQAANIALNGGDFAQAEVLATQAMLGAQIAPLDRARAYFARGVARVRLERRNDALVDFTQALWLKVLPRDAAARVLYDRGIALDELGRIHDAIGDYSGAILLEPHFADAYNNRANAFRRLGDLGKAKRDYKLAIAYGGEQEYSYYGLGQIAEAQHAMKAARRFYARALAANPKFALAAQGLASLNAISRTVEVAQARPAPAAALAPRPAPRPASVPSLARASYEVATVAPPPPPQAAPEQPEPVLRASIMDGARASLAAAEAPPPSPGGPQVQLGAWRSEADAADGWNHIAGAAGGLLKNARPHIVTVDLPGKGRYYRLRAEPTGGASAGELCDALKSRGFACLPVRA